MIHLASQYAKNYSYPIPEWLSNRIISAALEPVLSHTKNHVSQYILNNFPGIIKYNSWINISFVGSLGQL